MPYEIIIPDKIQRIINKKFDKHLKTRLFTKIDENKKLVIVVGFKHKDEMT